MKSAIYHPAKAPRWLLALALAWAGPLAAEGDQHPVSLQGFGTLGLMWNSTDKAAYIRDISQPSGAKGGFDGNSDTRLGIQASAALTETLSVTGQVVAKYNYEGRFTPQLTWGFVKFQSSETVELRAGRLGWDVYMLADSRDVGYSYLWARPPVEYFGHLQLSKLNGADLVVTQPLGSGLAWAKVFAGRTVDKVAIDKDSYFDVTGSELSGGHLNYQQGNWHYRLGYTRLDLDISLEGKLGGVIDGLAHSGNPILAAIASAFDAGNIYEFLSAGVVYDKGPVTTQFMYTTVDQESDSYPDSQHAFVSLGYRAGRWTPYATLAIADITTDAPGLPPEFISGPLGELASLGGVVRAGQHTVTLGTRYDVTDQLALKFQVDHSRVQETMLWREVEPDWNGRATLVSATLDFVF